MLTQEQVLDAVKNGRASQCLDRRDFFRLADFFPLDEWHHFGFEVKVSDKKVPTPSPWTQETIVEKLRADLEFAKEKAANQRGISAALMYEVVLMWLWVFEDDLQHHDNYFDYGLPFFKRVAAKYAEPDAQPNEPTSETAHTV